jgi:hypothetical protein
MIRLDCAASSRLARQRRTRHSQRIDSLVTKEWEASPSIIFDRHPYPPQLQLPCHAENCRVHGKLSQLSLTWRSVSRAPPRGARPRQLFWAVIVRQGGGARTHASNRVVFGGSPSVARESIESVVASIRGRQGGGNTPRALSSPSWFGCRHRRSGPPRRAMPGAAAWCAPLSVRRRLPKERHRPR